jgi:hypothetical protein
MNQVMSHMAGFRAEQRALDVQESMHSRLSQWGPVLCLESLYDYVEMAQCGSCEPIQASQFFGLRQLPCAE